MNPAITPASVPLRQALLLGAVAGGMGWGIRGQYGHETGAMIAGVLLTLVLALLFSPQAGALPVARAVAWGTIAIGFGGSMTYGQTIGLTHDAPLIGNWSALTWGMLGLATKGAIWIGFAGAFFGMGLGGGRYGPRDMLLVMPSLLALCALGIWLLNEPFDPAHRILPRIYFSDDWHWEPGAALKPRREVWGGLLLALLGLLAWLRWGRLDPLAPRLGLWAMLGGALGFPAGQCLQAFHAWNPELFRTGVWAAIDPHLNWWNWMETTFGAIMGAGLGLGLWVNRERIKPAANPANPALSASAELGLLGVHVAFLTTAEFGPWPRVEALYDFGLVMGLIPMIAVAGGRWAPFVVLLPITALPIAGKTVDQLICQDATMNPAAGWLLCFFLPMAITTGTAVWFARRSQNSFPAIRFLRPALLLTTWLYFGLNYAFCHFPWPWAHWTARTPNAIVFTFCAGALTIAWWKARQSGLPERSEPAPG